MATQTLVYAGTYNRLTLVDELLAAIPALAPVTNAAGQREAPFQFGGDAAGCWLTCDAAIAPAAVQAVISAHNPATVAASVTARLARKAQRQQLRDAAARFGSLTPAQQAAALAAALTLIAGLAADHDGETA